MRVNVHRLRLCGSNVEFVQGDNKFLPRNNKGAEGFPKTYNLHCMSHLCVLTLLYYI